MKKSFFALTAMSVFTGAAHAQSSVTLYGIIDAGIAYVNNEDGQHNFFTTSGNLSGSRWGLRGKEDIGGGLSVIFVVESGFNVFNGTLGQGGDMFGRQAYVGLSSTQYGSVTLGRQYDSVVDYTGPFIVADQWGSYLSAHPGDLDNMNNTNRVNNSVKFSSANYAGFTFGGLYSLGGVAGQFNRNQIWSLGAGYSNGPLQLGVGYLNVQDPNYSFYGDNASSRTSSTSGSSLNFSSRATSGFASAKTLQVITVGGAYTFGAATFGATYSNTQFQDVGTEAGTGSSLNPAGYKGGSGKFHNVELNFKYQLTPTLVAGVAYDYTKGYGLSDAKYNQGALGLDYFVSKRTDLYAVAVYQHASGTDSTQHAAVANINQLTPSSTPNQVAALIGIRHKF